MQFNGYLKENTRATRSVFRAQKWRCVPRMLSSICITFRDHFSVFDFFIYFFHLQNINPILCQTESSHNVCFISSHRRPLDTSRTVVATMFAFRVLTQTSSPDTCLSSLDFSPQSVNQCAVFVHLWRNRRSRALNFFQCIQKPQKY